jgi:hypothetical protein
MSFRNRVQEVNWSLLSISWDVVWLPVLQNIVCCWCSCSSPNHWLQNCDLWSHEIKRHCWMGVPESLRIVMHSVSRLMQNYTGPHSQVQFSICLINLLTCGHQEAGLSGWWSFCGWKKLCNQPLFRLLQDFLTSNLFPTNNALCFCLYTTFVCMDSLLACCWLAQWPLFFLSFDCHKFMYLSSSIKYHGRNYFWAYHSCLINVNSRWEVECAQKSLSLSLMPLSQTFWASCWIMRIQTGRSSKCKSYQITINSVWEACV